MRKRVSLLSFCVSLFMLLLLVGCSANSELMEVTGATKEQETVIMDILKNCAIPDSFSIQHDELLDGMNKKGEKGYRVSSALSNNVILCLNEDLTVNQIRYADNALYEGGKVKAKLTDYVFTMDEATDYQLRTQRGVKAVLKSPSTAKFPNIAEWAMSKDSKKVIVQAYVDSQNSFGANMRSDFTVTYSADGEKVTSFIFDGVEYIKK